MIRELDAALAASQNGAAYDVFRLHPRVVRDYLDSAWVEAQRSPQRTFHVQPGVLELPGGLRAPNEAILSAAAPLIVRHLVYAYLIESTGVIDVFREVVRRFATGEDLGAPTAAGLQWLRSTEALWYSGLDPMSMIGVTSEVRPDPSAVRRNAYHRMFGVELPRRGGASEFPKSSIGNTEFVATFERLMREIWGALTNRTNQSGPNATDDAAMTRLVQQLEAMLGDRRRGGNLQREELYAVTFAEWCHLTLLGNTPIIANLRAEANSPEERLKRVGERVGIPVSSVAGHFFELADEMSKFLLEVEQGTYSNSQGVQQLYGTSTQPGVSGQMRTVIVHWSAATGRDLKVRPSVAV